MKLGEMVIGMLTPSSLAFGRGNVGQPGLKHDFEAQAAATGPAGRGEPVVSEAAVHMAGNLGFVLARQAALACI
jgi:hypothetical protein